MTIPDWPPPRRALEVWLGDGEPVVETYGRHTATLLAAPGGDYRVFDTIPDKGELADYYNGEYFRTRRSRWLNREAQYDEARWSGILETLEGIRESLGLDRPMRVHDVGCGFGGLVHHLRARGFEATGTEPIVRAVKLGRQGRLNPHIHDLSATDFLAGQRPQDVIVLHHVIEHLPDPTAVLRGLAAFLAPDGAMVLRLPNSRYLGSVKRGIRNHWFGYPNHLHYFGPHSIHELLTAVGFADVSVTATTTELETDAEIDEVRSYADGKHPDRRAFRDQLVSQLATKELEVVARAIEGTS